MIYPSPLYQIELCFQGPTSLDFVFRVRPPPSIFEDLDLEVTDLEVTDLVFDIFPKHRFLDVLVKFKFYFFENISENIFENIF